MAVNVNEVLPKFKELANYSEKGDYYVASCPLHDDRRPSLALSKNGILRCYSGCDHISIYKYFSEQGVELYPEPEWKEVARWDYNGLGTKIRLEGVDHNGYTVKKFNWINIKVPNIRHLPLYGDATNELVFFVEGEKACDALLQHGYSAVTGAWSSSTKSDFELGVFEPLRNKDVIIWRDNDEPGQKYAVAMLKILSKIAKSIRVVCYDAGVGYDAYDYFVDHDDVSHILSTKSAVKTDIITSDYIRVSIDTNLGTIVFDVEDLTPIGTTELWSRLTVTVMTVEYIESPYMTRINLYSTSGRSILRQELTNQFGKDVDPGGWAGVISKVWAEVINQRRNTERGMSVKAGVMKTQQHFVIEHLIPENEDSIIFAPEASGKSVIGLHAALAVASGKKFGGLLPVMQGGVIYVDYERTYSNFIERLTRIASGMGINRSDIENLPIRYWPGDGIPLPDQVGPIRKLVKELDAKLVIVDSLGFAVAGDMFSPTAPINYYKKRLDCATLSIGQVPSADSGKLYGNKYWKYAPHGYIWNMKILEHTDQNMSILLINDKFSDWKKPESIRVNMDFNGKMSSININIVPVDS